MSSDFFGIAISTACPKITSFLRAVDALFEIDVPRTEAECASVPMSGPICHLPLEFMMDALVPSMDGCVASIHQTSTTPFIASAVIINIME